MLKKFVIRVEQFLARRPRLLRSVLKTLDTLGLFGRVQRFVSSSRNSGPKAHNENIVGISIERMAGSYATESDKSRIFTIEKFLEGNRPNGQCKRRVGVLISVFEADPFIENLVVELGRQTIMGESEVVFHLSNPSDFVLDVVRGFVNSSPGSQLIVKSSKIPLYEAWNECLDVFSDSVEYLTNWNVDDSRWEFSIERAVSILDKLPEFDVYFTDYIVSKVENLSWRAALESQPIAGMRHVTYRSMLEESATPHSAPIWRRRLHDLHGGFDANLKIAGDRDFWLRVAKSGHVFFHDPIPASVYFVNPKGLSSSGFTGYDEWSAISTREKKILRRAPTWTDVAKTRTHQE